MVKHLANEFLYPISEVLLGQVDHDWQSKIAINVAS